MELLAHGLGGRSDLPIPLWLAIYGAIAAVLISFFALARFWREPRFQTAASGRALPHWAQVLADSSITRTLLRVIGLVLFAVLLAVAWIGPDDASVNPAPTWFYVWWWVGLVPASLLFGPVARLISPMRAVSEAIRILVRRTATRDQTASDLVVRLGWWPSVVGLAAFLWLELASGFSDSPQVVAAFLTGYAVLHVGVGVILGPAWFDRGEGFEAYSTLLATMSPLGRGADRRLILRNPFDGLSRLNALYGNGYPGLVAFCCLILGSTAFDGLTRTSLWRDIARQVDGTAMSMLLGTGGLLLSVAVVTAVYYFAAMQTTPYLFGRQEVSTRTTARSFVHSLVPVAIGYTVAHYFSFAVFQGQAGWLLADDPFGRGWSLLGVSEAAAIDYTVVSPAVIALVQMAAIVAGHIGGVVAAHDRAVELLPRKRQSAGQYPMLATMVGFTSLGIALLAGS